MNKEKLIEDIEQYINQECENFDVDSYDFENDEIESFMRNSAIRLVNTYAGMQNGNVGFSDYISALRNFMLVYQTPLRIEDSSFLDDNHAGIYKQTTGFRYYASYDVPNYITYPQFVEKAFVTHNTQKPVLQTKYNLRTNTFIKNLTGFEHFKSVEQKLSVYGALNTPSGYTTLISMPTGGGKSLITQALAYAYSGLTIVVVPTVSLAIDQERAAKNNIAHSADAEIFCYYSGINNFSEIAEAITQQKARLLFISPEALIKNDQFKQLIETANSARYIKNIVIDEAHIVIAWGDYFRVDYQCLEPWRDGLLQINPDIKTFLLSATFEDYTVNLLKKMFSNGTKWIEIRCDALRREPQFVLVNAKNHRDKCLKVLDMVNKLPHPLILYVNAPYAAKQWKDYLQKYGYENVRMFTGETKSVDRNRLINEWSENKYEIMIATSAFGVGVDKPDVRTVIHLYVPENPDTYYQELGRGGRDGLPCLSVMCIDEDDISSAYNHVGKVLTTDKFWGRWWSMFRNPDNMWQNGLIAMSASIKPNYNKTNYFEEGNDTDEKWNINVLLLLNRYNKIKIKALDLDSQNRYIFTIQILEEKIITENTIAKEIFDEIREKESLYAQKSFALIRRAINNADKTCWSEMFYNTYPLVSEYCAGCNQHSETMYDELNRFPLLQNVKEPTKNISQESKNFFATTHEAIIISTTEKGRDSLIYEYKPNIIVSDYELENTKDKMPDYCDLAVYNFQEFTELASEDNDFYISGVVMIIYDNEKAKVWSDFKKIQKYIKRKKGYVIHVLREDYYLEETDKKISEMIDGALILSK